MLESKSKEKGSLKMVTSSEPTQRLPVDETIG